MSRDGELRADISSFEGRRDLAGFAAVQDECGYAVRKRKIHCLKLCSHSTDRHLSLVGTDMSRNLGDIRGAGNAMTLGVHQPVGRGYEQQKVGIDEFGNLSREPVVIAKTKLLNSNGVVFVDDRHDVSGLKNALDRVKRVPTAHTAVDIVMRQQKLSDPKAVTPESSGVHAHKLRLACGGTRLLAGKIFGTAVQPQHVDPRSNRGAADDYAGIPRLDKQGNFGRKAAKLTTIQGNTSGARENTRAKLNDDTRHGGRRIRGWLLSVRRSHSKEVSGLGGWGAFTDIYHFEESAFKGKGFLNAERKAAA